MPSLRVQIGDEARERENGRLRHRVVGHARRRSLPRGRREVHDRPASLSQGRKRSTDRPHVAHDVQLPVLEPLLVGDLLEARDACRADVVHEDVEPAERGDGFGDDALGLAVSRQVRDDVRGLADPRRAASATGDDDGSFRDELPDDLEPDTAGGAGHEALLAAQSEIHGRLG